MDYFVALGRGLIGLADNLMLRISRVTYLPPAAADTRGALVRLEGADGAADVLYLAVKQADDTFAWQALGSSGGGGGTGTGDADMEDVLLLGGM